MTEPIIAVLLDFYDINGNERLNRRLTAISFKDIVEKEKKAEENKQSCFINLQDIECFDNISAMPGFLYDIYQDKNRSRWRLALNSNKQRGEYDAIQFTKIAPNEPKLTALKSYNFTDYFNYCRKNPNNNYMKHCALSYTLNNTQIIVIVTAINTTLTNESIPEATERKLYDSHEAYLKQAFEQFNVKQSQLGD